MNSGLEALEDGRGWVDVSSRGRIKLTGDDRARLLHALTTNHIQELKPGQESYAFFLTAQGKIISDAHIACYDDHLLVDVDAEVRESLIRHIDHYIIADDVVIEDISASSFGLIAAGKRLYGNAGEKEAAVRSLGLVEASTEDYEVYRIRRFHPRFGPDFGNTTLAQETGLNYALHFNKGCYLGQEIVERVRSRAQIHKMLAGFAFPGDVAPAPGTAILMNSAEMGRVTSAVSVDGLTSAIGMIRTQGAKPGTEVEIAGVTAKVHAVT